MTFFKMLAVFAVERA